MCSRVIASAAGASRFSRASSRRRCSRCDSGGTGQEANSAKPIALLQHRCSHGAQVRIRTSLDRGGVELDVQIGVIGGFRGDRRFHGGRNGAQLRQRLVGEVLDGQAHRHTFERRPDVRRFQDLLRVQLGNGRPDVRLHLQPTFARQTDHGLAHRDLAGPQLQRDLIDDQPRAGRVVAAHDPLAERLIDQIGFRSVLHQRVAHWQVVDQMEWRLTLLSGSILYRVSYDRYQISYTKLAARQWLPPFAA